MADQITISVNDVISVLEKAKTERPWGNCHGEKYRCLIFWRNNSINMTVNEFRKLNETTFSCCRYYTTVLCNTIDEYNNLSDEQLSSKAYNAWCNGAR